MNSNEMYSDLKKKFLDELVRNNRNMLQVNKDVLIKRVHHNLSIMNKVFADKDPLISKQATPPVYYLFIKYIHSIYGHTHLNSLLKKFLDSFVVMRKENNQILPEEARDSVLLEYDRLNQQATNDLSNLRKRVGYLTRFFLQDNPDVRIKDPKRTFTEEERHVIWLLGEKKCAACGKQLPDLGDMQGDHPDQHIHGGPTTFKNSRCLCLECNPKLQKKTK